MKRNPTLPPNFMLGYAIAAPNLQNYGSQGRRGLVDLKELFLHYRIVKR
ncbi:MAG: hypothetical protein V7L11_07755 [Nostoc sp.]